MHNRTRRPLRRRRYAQTGRNPRVGEILHRCVQTSAVAVAVAVTTKLTDFLLALTGLK